MNQRIPIFVWAGLSLLMIASIGVGVIRRNERVRERDTIWTGIVVGGLAEHSGSRELGLLPGGHVVWREKK